MIGKLLKGLIDFVISLITFFLTPLDNLIETNFPSLNSALNSVNSFITYVIGVIGYAIDASCLTDVVLLLIVAYYSFTITLSIAVFVAKFVIKWYRALVP